LSPRETCSSGSEEILHWFIGKRDLYDETDRRSTGRGGERRDAGMAVEKKGFLSTTMKNTAKDEVKGEKEREKRISGRERINTRGGRGARK